MKIIWCGPNVCWIRLIHVFGCGLITKFHYIFFLLSLDMYEFVNAKIICVSYIGSCRTIPIFLPTQGNCFVRKCFILETKRFINWYTVLLYRCGFEMDLTGPNTIQWKIKIFEWLCECALLYSTYHFILNGSFLCECSLFFIIFHK